jgi:serine/threonine-protein kinase
MIGETFGSYRVTEKIGEGGMGAVYLAEHTLIGRKVAVKVLLPEHSRKQDLVDRFFNEAKTAAGLNHPALVDVFDFGVHPSGSAYLVMDFLDGESLGNRLTRVAPLPPELAVDLARQIARGMEAAHGRGIVHRDLKPDNIFLVPDAEDPSRDQVKILDFGIAKLLGAPSASRGATSTGMVLGTPLFMAPEQCRGTGVVDHRADIYSLGCILYFMLCGRPPFAYEGVGEILGAHLHEPVMPPRSINPTVPQALEAVVLKALAKNPDERYQTMAALAADLAKLSSTTGAVAAVPALPPTMVLPTVPGPTTLSTAAAAIPVVPTPPTRRRLVVPIAGAFAAGLVLGVVALLRARPASRPGQPDTIAVVGKSGGAAISKSGGAPAPSGAPAPARPAPPSAAPIHPSPAPAAAAQATPSPAGAPPGSPSQGTPSPPTPSGGPPSGAPSPPTASSPAAATAGPAPAATPTSRRERRSQPAHDRGEAYARGITHLARGDEREALEAFRTYLRGSDLSPARRSEAQGYVISLQHKFGEIEVSCELPGAEVAVDGHPVGRSPLNRSIALLPGAHEVVVTKEGYQSLHKSFRIVAGERMPLFLHLAR